MKAPLNFAVRSMLYAIIFLLMQVITKHEVYSKNNFDFTPIIGGYSSQQEVFVADMNGDGYDDIVMFDAANHLIKVSINNQDLSYSNYVSSNMAFTTDNNFNLTIANDETIIDIADMNGDGKADIIIYKSGIVNDELGYYACTNPNYIFNSLNTFVHDNWVFQSGEFNNDNIPDIFGYNFSNGDINVLLNVANPTFAFWYNIGVLTNPHFYTGNFTTSAFKELAFSYETAANTYKVTVVDNVSGTNFTTGFSTGSISGANLLFYDGKFTNSTYEDFVMFNPTGQTIRMIVNTGSAFNAAPYNNWYSPAYANAPLEYKHICGEIFGNNRDELIEFYANTPIAGYQGSVNILTTNAGNNAYSKNTWNLEQGAGALSPASNDWEIVKGHFRNNGRTDLLFYSATNNKIKVGLNMPTLEGFCWPLSATNSGNESIKFYIQGQGSSNVEITRYTSSDDNVQATVMTSFTITPTTQQIPEDAYVSGCGWSESYTLTIPNNWESGFYGAKLTDDQGRVNCITFIVKSSIPSCNKIALLANVNTWQAYNNWSGGAGDLSYVGGYSKYVSNDIPNYSFLRPNPIASLEDHASIEQGVKANQMHLARAELWIYTWLKSNGYEPDVITDIDFSLNIGNVRETYKTIIMGTHPEYWTGNMYDNAKYFQHNGNGITGGNLICIGGNSVFEICDYIFTPNNKQISFFNGLPNQGGYRYNYLFQNFLFNGNTLKRPLDLIGVHHQVINPNGNNNNSFSKTAIGLTSPLMNGIAGTTLGNIGYNKAVVGLPAGANAFGAAAGWETDKYTDNAPDVNAMGYPPNWEYLIIPPSIYANMVEVIASTSNANTYNSAEIIYVPPVFGTDQRGFVFTAGSITFGGSLIADADLQKLMNNVLHLEPSMLLSVTNIDCSNNPGSIQATNCTASTFNLMPGNVNNITGYFPNLVANTYTVTCTDALGYTQTSLVDLISPTTGNFCCSPDAQNLIANTPNLILQSAPSAANLLTLYGNGTSIISNKTFYIDDVLTIDHDITFNNCTLWFTPTGNIQLQGPYTLDVNASTLQASCDWWGGIVANDPQQKVSMNGSTMKNSGVGVHVLNNVIIEIANCNFENNGQNDIYLNNMTLNPYPGYIKGCTFSSQNNLPGNQWNKTERAIELNNVRHLNIGDITIANSGNIFSGMYTGVYISQNSNANCEIGIYNNSFSNIADDGYTGGNIHSQIINDCYSNLRGAAVMADFNGVPNVASRIIDVRNTNAANANLPFENCDKGIVSLGFPVNAKNLFMDHCLMGVMNNLTTAHSYDIQDNTINNTFIGMQFVGDNANSVAIHNTITHDPSLTWLPTTWPPAMGQQYIWPTGIDLKYVLNTNPNSFLIEDNAITISDFAGKGISLNNTSAQVKARINTINLTNSDVSPIVCNGASDLSGIAIENGKGTKILKNNIYGNVNGGLLAQAREDMAGILLNKTTDHETQCNYMEKTRFGMLAWNNCSTDKLNVKGNTVHESVLGWAFRHLVDEGTFGQVGTLSNENNNQFTGPPPSAKVFKFCENQQTDQIYTNLVDPFTESQSINLNTNVLNDCQYLITANPGATPFTSCVNLIVANNSTTSITLSEALSIANNTKQYAEYPELGHWYDSKRLYEYLRSNDSFKNSHADLVAFFNTITDDAVAHEQIAEQWLTDLIEAYTAGNNAILEGLQDGTYTANNNIDDTELQDANEAMINSIYLKILRYGLDSVTQADSTFIAELAPQCPYVGGSAVFKARTLNAYYHPGNMFDDIKLCNQVGVFKQGGNNNNDENNKSKLTRENEYLQKLLPVNKSVLNKLSKFAIFPNPVTSNITIAYELEEKEKGTVVIYDILGREQFSIELSSKNNKVSANVSNLPLGIYTYKYLINNRQVETGKLIKE